jgi:integrase
VSLISHGDIESVLRGQMPSVRNAFLRYLRAVLNWGIRRGYLTGNPVGRVEFATVKRAETQIYTPEEIQRLLDDCLAQDLGLLPYRVLNIFCGIRPRGEMSRVTWADVAWTERVVKLRASVTKKGRSRYPVLSDNAMAWLEAYRAAGGPMEGSSRIMPYSQVTLDARCRANHHRAGVRSIRNGSRHSYCSYHLAMHGKIDELTVQAGHRDPKTLWDHYYHAATKEEAQRFWSVLPKTTPSNVVTIAA